jgi:type I restriction enzyme M protein
MHQLNNIPDILAKWRGLRDGTLPTSNFSLRTSQSLLVPKAEIAGNDYDLSINRSKEVEYEAVEYDPPAVILARLAKLEEEIAEGRRELEGMLRA